MAKAQQVWEQLDQELSGPAEIPPPAVEEMGSGYRLLFREQAIEVLVTGVHWHGEDAVAVLAVNLLTGTEVKRLEFGRLNLYSTRARAELAKSLRRRWEADWEGLLRQVCEAVLEQETQGEDGVLLRDIEPTRDEDLLEGLPGLCLANDATLLFGNGGDGKSLLLLAIGCVLSGLPVLPGVRARRRCRVALADWEWSPQAHRRRLEALAAGVGGEMPDLLYLRCRQPLARELPRLSVQVARHGIDYLLVDSVAWACGGAPEEAERATAFQGALRQLGRGALCTAHTNRSGDTQLPFGSMFWHNSMRSTWYLRKDQEVNAASLTLGLFNRKSNGDALAPPRAWSLVFEDGGRVIRARPVDATTVPELRGQLPVGDRLIGVLREAGRPLTYEELAKEADVGLQVVRNTVARRARDFVRLAGDGRTTRVALRAREDAEDVNHPANHGLNRFAGDVNQKTKPGGGLSDPPGLVWFTHPGLDGLERTESPSLQVISADEEGEGSGPGGEDPEGGEVL